MDTRKLTDTLVADLDPTTRSVVAAYLQELASALPGSRRTREAILTEIADGLIEQITNTTGPDPAVGVEAAIRAFGTPETWQASSPTNSPERPLTAPVSRWWSADRWSAASGCSLSPSLQANRTPPR